MALKKKTPAPTSAITVCHDFQRRTCLQVERAGGHVKYIPLNVGTGLMVHQMSADVFDQRYVPMVNYPIEKAAQLYLSYSQNIGATKEALEYLGQIITVTKQEFDMATKKAVTKAGAAEDKRAAVAAKTTTKPAVTKAVTAKTTPAKTTAKAAPTKAVPAAKTKTAPAKAGEKKSSAAQMFQDLIMEGKLTDDQIFEKVQEAFGLDEKKRGYVKWYRNHLTKQGKNPPAAKAGK